MLDINALMASLAEKRPIFHSEADFQHALAWEIHLAKPECEIRVQYPVRVKDPTSGKEKSRVLDIWMPAEQITIELKYPKQPLTVFMPGEDFVFTSNDAHDQKRYDYLKDIQRLEYEVGTGRAKHGFAILLTNTQGYWNPSQHRDQVDAAFRIQEGREVTGDLKWSHRAAQGTMAERETSIVLKGSYRLHWKDYSRLTKDNTDISSPLSDSHSHRYFRQLEKHGRFRYLAVHVHNL